MRNLEGKVAVVTGAGAGLGRAEALALARAGAAVVVNEPVRRGRVTGTDLLPRFADAAGLDVFGIGTDRLHRAVAHPDVTVVGDLPQHRLHAEMARRRAYLHPVRWTSLGLSLLEAMHLGLPVVALATTEVVEAVPAGGTAVLNADDPRVLGMAPRAAGRGECRKP